MTTPDEPKDVSPSAREAHFGKDVPPETSLPRARKLAFGKDVPPETSLPTARKLAFGQTLRAVAWSFLGIRRSADHEQDVRKLNPIHVVIAAVLGAAIFVVFLVVLVHFVTSAATH